MAATNEAYDLELFSPREPELRALADNKKAARDKQRRNRRQSADPDHLRPGRRRSRSCDGQI